MNTLRIVVSSPPDRDSVVAELWQNDEQIAELRRDGSELRLELYNSRSATPRDLDYHEFVAALSRLGEELA